MPSKDRGAFEALGNEDLRRHLREALGTLPERAAEVFVLRHFEDRGNLEIAEMLGMTQVGVAVTLHRARKKLQDELRKAGVRP
jgi:RNA polymerase sigma-70 factor (ECF subfamily)